GNRLAIVVCEIFLIAVRDSLSVTPVVISSTLPLPVSFTILKKLFACVYCDTVYHPPCPGVLAVTSVPKLPMLKLSKFSEYNTWLYVLLKHSTVVKISKHFFIILNFKRGCL